MQKTADTLKKIISIPAIHSALFLKGAEKLLLFTVRLVIKSIQKVFLGSFPNPSKSATRKMIALSNG